MLEVGTSVRYRSIGAGKVIEHTVRDFNGQKRTFAVIHAPHREMTIQVPIGDPDVEAKLHPVTGASDLRKMLKNMTRWAKALPRSWDVREEQGEAALLDPNPDQWIRLLGSYALAEGSGVVVAASDEDLVRKAEELIAAELACAADIEFSSAVAEVNAAYMRVVKQGQKQGQRAEHFAAVAVTA